MLESLFKLEANRTTAPREIAAGVTTASSGKGSQIHPFMWGIGAFSVLDVVLTAL